MAVGLTRLPCARRVSINHKPTDYTRRRVQSARFGRSIHDPLGKPVPHTRADCHRANWNAHRRVGSGAQLSSGRWHPRSRCSHCQGDYLSCYCLMFTRTLQMVSFSLRFPANAASLGGRAAWRFTFIWPTSRDAMLFYRDNSIYRTLTMTHQQVELFSSALRKGRSVRNSWNTCAMGRLNITEGD